MKNEKRLNLFGCWNKRTNQITQIRSGNRFFIVYLYISFSIFLSLSLYLFLTLIVCERERECVLFLWLCILHFIRGITYFTMFNSFSFFALQQYVSCMSMKQKKKLPLHPLVWLVMQIVGFLDKKTDFLAFFPHRGSADIFSLWSVSRDKYKKQL